jgi:hypothetical protein
MPIAIARSKSAGSPAKQKFEIYVCDMNGRCWTILCALMLAAGFTIRAES